jgi:hypothetical protein
MAKYRLLRAHFLPGDKWLPGDLESDTPGLERGTVVGDGTEHPIRWPTLEMEPLDDEARAMIDKERARIEANDGAMDPVEALPLDSYERQYVPGSNARRTPPKPDGATVVSSAKR